MYHPSRGGVRGGRDQFTWDDVKVDKHRENYLGHSIKAPVGRWQKGKDLHWYARDKKSESLNSDALKEEIQRIKEEEELAMREALGLAPKRATKVLGNRLDKHEFAELVKRGSTAEDLGAGHAEAAHVQGLGFSRAQESNLSPSLKWEGVEMVVSQPAASSRNDEKSDYQSSEKKRKHEEDHGKERNQEKREGRHKQHSRDSDDKRRHKKDKGKRRHDSD